MTDLTGLRILVTRPAGQEHELMNRLTALHAHPVHYAAIEILEPHDTATLANIMGHLPTFAWAIFISPNAVARAWNLWLAQGQPWPTSVRMACIGRGSARALKRFGVTDVLTPGGRFDSESLLALPEMHDVKGLSVVIFRGEGGRELLGDTLTERGARVAYAECYRRGVPTADISSLLRTWARHGIDIVILTSIDGLHNLYDALGQVGRRWFAKTPLIVPSERVHEACRAIGLEGDIIIADGADEDALIAALHIWRHPKNLL